MFEGVTNRPEGLLLPETVTITLNVVITIGEAMELYRSRSYALADLLRDLCDIYYTRKKREQDVLIP
ncbi:unnamed protein product [Mucor hiemalis]